LPLYYSGSMLRRELIVPMTITILCVATWIVAQLKHVVSAELKMTNLINS